MMNYGISMLNAAIKPDCVYQKRREQAASLEQNSHPRGPKWSETIFKSKIEAIAYGLFAMNAQTARGGFQMMVNLRTEATLANLDYDLLVEAYKALHVRDILTVYFDHANPEQALIGDFGQVPPGLNIDTDRLTAVCAYVRQREGKYHE